jgi:purine-binding chemotaxis protein CheW
MIMDSLNTSPVQMTSTGSITTSQSPANAPTTNGLIVSLQVGGQLCGLPVQAVRDVLGPQTITRVPLAAPEIAGNLNLRGRIVTTIDLRKRLNLAIPDSQKPAMSVVTEYGLELYALLVDRVLEVVSVSEHTLSPLPPTLATGWSQFGTGVYQLSEGLLIMLDVGRLLALTSRAA